MHRMSLKQSNKSFGLSFFSFLLILSVTMSACGGGGGGVVEGGGAIGETPVAETGTGPAKVPETGTEPGGAPRLNLSITIDPPEATLTAKGSQTFSANITGTDDRTVVWSVQEGPTGGTVNGEGRYTAPELPGSYHLIAASQADPSQTAAITVNVVAEPVVSVAISPASLGIMTFNLVHDTKYKTFFEKLLAETSWKRREGMPVSEKPSNSVSSKPEGNRRVRRVFSWIHKFCEIHVAMNLLTACAFLTLIPSVSFMDFRFLFFGLYFLAGPFLAIVKSHYLIGGRRIDEEFNSLFYNEPSS